MASSSARPETCYWCGEQAEYNKQGFASPFWELMCIKVAHDHRWYWLCPACADKRRRERE